MIHFVVFRSWRPNRKR